MALTPPGCNLRAMAESGARHLASLCEKTPVLPGNLRERSGLGQRGRSRLFDGLTLKAWR